MCKEINNIYTRKIQRRMVRMPFFYKKFHVNRVIKSILLLPISLVFILFLPNTKNKTIVYRPKKNERNIILNWNKVLLIGGYDDFLFARRKKIQYYPFFPLYATLNLKLFSLIRNCFFNSLPKRIVIFNDMGLDGTAFNFFAKKFNFNVWCLQHGLFPLENNRDIEGMDCGINVVHSEMQKSILKETGYKGKIIIGLNFFSSYGAPSKIEWISCGRPVVFIGPGYIDNNDRQVIIDRILIDISQKIPDQCRLLYRPHPRENSAHFSDVVKRFVVKDDYETSIINKGTLIFIGIKSTLLYEAQVSGRLGILIEDNSLPNYFKNGEIDVTVQSHSTDLISSTINEFVKIF